MKIFEMPGDKSISHRAIILGSISEGKTIIENCLISEDVLRTVDCFKALGVDIKIKGSTVIIIGNGLKGLRPPKTPLYCGNSGTTVRLISGVLVAQNFCSEVEGDFSLNKRPMDRIILPLRLMGGNIKGRKDKFPPLEIEPTNKLKGIDYRLPVASAQVKSALILGAVYGEGATIITEKAPSRDHTERMIKYFDGNIKKINNKIIVKPVSKLNGKKVYVPGDISSAAYFIVGALILEGTGLLIKNVGINETRIGFIQVLKKMGGSIDIVNFRSYNNEPMADIYVEHSKLKGIEIKGNIIGKLIDEIPILAVAATMAEGKTIIKDAKELKYKETNRIDAMVNELRKMGSDIKKLEDGMIIEGRGMLKGGKLKSYNDHRIVMALSIAGLCAKDKIYFDSTECVKISFPNFFNELSRFLD
ncbi:MAG TPA: 3-phosphoshikimate 1-carboxyvinyltransferase [Tissierellales bacterium]|nr:3-phosphoshikimate 1-carboxyvinyltransferase [Tissierellales bacterium]